MTLARSNDHPRSPFVATAAVIALAATVAGCAAPAKSGAMVPDGVAGTSQSPRTVTVAVAGGQETDPLVSSEISAVDFRRALIESIETSRMFSDVLPSGGDYQLEVLIASVDHPTFGGNFTIDMATQWTVTRRKDGKVLLQDIIPVSYKATMGESFVAIKRLRKGMEGAARESIRQGLARIARLDL